MVVTDSDLRVSAVRCSMTGSFKRQSQSRSPRRTSKSTSVSACTDPNDFEIPRSWRIGVSLTGVGFPTTKPVEAPARAPPPVGPVWLLAVLRELADAHVALLQELVLEEPRVVGLCDRDDRNLDGRLLLAAVLAEPVDPGHLLVLQQRDGRLGGCVGLEGHVLVDGHRLPARDDVLHALHSRVLSR